MLVWVLLGQIAAVQFLTVSAEPAIRRAGSADVPSIVSLVSGLFAEDAGARDPTINVQ